MERTSAIEQLTTVTRRIAANIRQRPEEQETTLEDTAPIKQVMAMLTPEAVGLVPNAHTNITPAATMEGEIRYLHIAQESGFSIGIFVLPPGSCIPLHDHPHMSVVSHVLYGSVKITCYDWLEDSAAGGGGGGGGSGGSGGGSSGATAGRAALRGYEQAQVATLRSSGWYHAPHISCLTPSVANVHELQAGNHGTAILDVLLPPYDESSGRDCTYYSSQGGTGARVNLVPCSPGDSFRVARGYVVPPFLA